MVDEIISSASVGLPTAARTIRAELERWFHMGGTGGRY